MDEMPEDFFLSKIRTHGKEFLEKEGSMAKHFFVKKKQIKTKTTPLERHIPA